MVVLIEDLQKCKGYKLETFYLGVQIADHYLMKQAIHRRSAPCMIRLAAASLLIAVKLEEPKRPRITNMTYILEHRHKLKI